MGRHQERIVISGTELAISKLGLGTGPLGGMFSSVTEKQSDDLVEFALGRGINFFDTAPFYGYGTSEIRLGRALKKNEKPYVLSTKVGRVLNPAIAPDKGIFVDVPAGLEPIFDLSADGIKRSLEESLVRLGVEHIDIALIHDAENYMDQAISEAYPVLDDYRRQGLIKGIGTGMTRCAETIRFIHECDLNVVLIAGRLTLLDQEAAVELLPLALKEQVSVIVGGVFNSGILANPNPEATFDYAKAPEEIIAKARRLKEFLNQRNISIT